jgi:threonylcarbamoyladenosine tRNA methylthiotransferase MtaB
MRVGIKTLGCKVNQAESDLLCTAFVKGNIEIVDFDEVADCYIVNSCAVTEEAERKTRQYIRRALRKNPGATVLLVGCCAKTWQGKDLSFPEKRVVVISSDPKEEAVCRFIEKTWGISLSLPPFPLPPRARAWVKIEDGCDHFCSFCLVPHLRRGVRSKDPLLILEEVLYLEDQGVGEIVLCGTNLGYFGRDLSSTTLIDLLELLVEKTRNVRFRLSSLEPYLVSENFLFRYFALGDRVCPHLHLPLQSGSDRILKKMQRGYSVEYYEDLVGKARRFLPHTAITTDVIVGFPGETEREFLETVLRCERIAFSRMHIFAFSPRPGTPAFAWEREEGVPKGEKQKRVRHLLEVAGVLAERYHRLFLGGRLRVLVEFLENGVGVGHSENYILVRVKGVGEDSVGRIVPVVVERADRFGLEGRIDDAERI